MKFVIILLILLTSCISSKLLRYKTGKLIRVKATLNIMPQTQKKTVTELVEQVGQEVYVEYNDQVPEEGVKFFNLHVKKESMKKEAIELIKTELGLSEGHIDEKGNLILQIPLKRVAVRMVKKGEIIYESKRANAGGEGTNDATLLVAEVGFDEFDFENDYFSILLLNINEDKNIVEIRIYLYEEKARDEFLQWGKFNIYENIVTRISAYSVTLIDLNNYSESIERKTKPRKKERRSTLKKAMQTELNGKSFCFNGYCLGNFYSLIKSWTRQNQSFYSDNVKHLITSYERLKQKQNFCIEALSRQVFVVMKDDGDIFETK
jgi:hypothetical protein